MITKIVEQLKTGTIENVIPFGVEHNLDPPYVVVKRESDPLGRGSLFRIIVHYLPGQIIFIDDYCNKEVFDLLNNFSATSRNGGYNTLLTENEYTDIVIENDDKTISKERLFLLPRVII